MKKLKKPTRKYDRIFSCYITEPGVGNTVGKSIIVTGGTAAAMTGSAVAVNVLTNVLGGNGIMPPPANNV